MLMNYTKACNPYSKFSAPVNGTSAIGCAEKAIFSGISRHVSHYRLCIKDGRKIESFFSKMTKQMLKGIWVNSKEELAERIYKYFDEVNADPVVYHWTYKLDEISEDEAKSNIAS